MKSWKFAVTVVISTLATLPSNAADSLSFSGFALLRPETAAPFVFDDQTLSVQVQLALDWQPVPSFRTHIHVLGRNEAPDSERGRGGVVEAYAEKNFIFTSDRVRLLAGAFFLPTSRENVDSLWETPYSISSSALNTWLGEEFRPIGIDSTYMRHTRTAGTFTLGGTVFGGNDTFGALPIDRGWAIHDRWTLLGERIVAREASELYSSVSAENDGRLGWSGRAKWNNDHGALQYTHIDNRSDAQRYGELFNWATRFNIVGADYTWGLWTVAGESGWGSTAIQGSRGRRSFDLDASYLLISRRIGKFRATLRADDFGAGTAPRGRTYTGALLFYPHPRLRTAIEVITDHNDQRYALEFRYRL
jgi:hypothetical protein